MSHLLLYGKKKVSSSTVSWREGVTVCQVATSLSLFIFTCAFKKRKVERIIAELLPACSASTPLLSVGKADVQVEPEANKGWEDFGKRTFNHQPKNKCSNICWTVSGVEFLAFSQMHTHSVPPSRRVWSSYTARTWEFYVWEDNIFLADCCRPPDYGVHLQNWLILESWKRWNPPRGKFLWMLDIRKKRNSYKMEALVSRNFLLKNFFFPLFHLNKGLMFFGFWVSHIRGFGFSFRCEASTKCDRSSR